MSLAITYSRTAFGIHAPQVAIEVHLSRGMPGLTIVGLPDKEIKESKDRVRSAIINSRFDFPVKRIVINLAPADLPKTGGRFDLPIALGILAASKQIPLDHLGDYEFAGELALNGDLRGVSGMLPFALASSENERQLMIPAQNAEEVSIVQKSKVFAAHSLLEVCAHLSGLQQITHFESSNDHQFQSNYPDLKDIIGQQHGKRALEIAAAGAHSLLLTGPPGTGKTMLASRLPGILPPLQEQQAMQTAALYSISRQQFQVQHWARRPFRAPHHTASSIALIGGGNPPKPGEVSLAHFGVLFLDELPEFSRHALEVLREPLESGKVCISRASHQIEFPARFQLVAAMNPCPCGYLGDTRGKCRCTKDQIQRYQSKISGPLLDRIDMTLQIPPLPTSMLLNKDNANGEASIVVQQRVVAANTLQLKRQAKNNAQLTGDDIKQYCELSVKQQQWMLKAVDQLSLSARAYHRVLRVARTIADLEGSNKIQMQHLQESLSYRKNQVVCG